MSIAARNAFFETMVRIQEEGREGCPKIPYKYKFFPCPQEVQDAHWANLLAEAANRGLEVPEGLMDDEED